MQSPPPRLAAPTRTLPRVLGSSAASCSLKMSRAPAARPQGLIGDTASSAGREDACNRTRHMRVGVAHISRRGGESVRACVNKSEADHKARHEFADEPINTSVHKSVNEPVGEAGDASALSKDSGKQVGTFSSYARMAFASGLGDDVGSLANELNKTNGHQDSGSVRTRVRLGYDRRFLVGLAAIVAVLVAMLVVFISLVRGERGTIAIPDREASSSSSQPATEATTSSESLNSDGNGRASAALSGGAEGEIVVYVSGAVGEPGVVTLMAGSRVADAVEAAGGLNENAQEAAINLAALLSDGQHIHVFEQGEQVTVVDGGSGTAGNSGLASSSGLPSAPSATSGGSGSGRVNVNTADATQLESIPGIGTVTAQKIITWRSTHGQITNVDELLDVDGIGEKTLDKIRPYISVR